MKDTDFWFDEPEETAESNLDSDEFNTESDFDFSSEFVDQSSDVESDSVSNETQQNQTSQPKKTSNKVIGIVLFVVLILVALVVSVISKVHITKKPVSKQTIQSTQVTQQSQSQQAKKTEEKPVTSDIKSPSTSNQESNKSTQETSENSKISSGNARTDVSSKTTSNNWTEVDASSIDFNSKVLETVGVVSQKKVFLTENNQLTYELIIEASNKNTFSYYCSQNVFENTEIDSTLTVKYQNISGTISVVSLSK
jgi:hypothetical protein